MSGLSSLHPPPDAFGDRRREVGEPTRAAGDPPSSSIRWPLLAHPGSHRSAFIATATALGLLWAGCTGSDGSDTATTSAPVSTAPSSTAIAPTTVPASDVVLLVAGPGGIGLLSDGGWNPVLDGEPIQTAVPDLAGGLFFVAGRSGELTAAPIEAITASGDDRAVVFAEPEARWIAIEDVAAIQGRPTLVYRVSRTLPNDCEPDTECIWQYQVEHLVVRDLETGEETNLGTVGSFESSGIRVSFGGERAVVTVSPYGTPYSCVGVLPAAVFLDAPDPDRWIGEGGSWRDEVGWIGPGACDGAHEGCPPDSPCTLPAIGAIDDEGTRAAVAWARQSNEPGGSTQPLTVEVIDLDGSTVLSETAIGEPDHVPTWIDFHGETLVVGRRRNSETLAPVLVGPDGTVTTLDIDGTARIWITSPG